MANISVQVHGNVRRSTATYNVVKQAGDSTARKPNMSIDLNFNFSRSSEKSSTMKVSVSGNLWRLCKYKSGSTSASYDSETGNYGSSKYEYHFNVYFGVGESLNNILGGWKQIVSKGSNPGKWQSSGYGVHVDDYEVDWGTSNKINVYLKIDGGCHIQTEGWCLEGDYSALVDSFSVPTYNPYTASSIWLNPNDYTKISKVNDGSWSVHYSYNAGSNDSVRISLAIHDVNAVQWKPMWEPILRDVSGSSDGVWDSYTLNTAQRFADGKQYRITLVSNKGETLSPNSWNPRDGLVIYTYTKPTISNAKFSRSPFSPQDNAELSWETNDLTFSNFEKAFTTTLKSNNKDISNVNQSTKGSKKFDITLINSLFDKKARSTKSINSSVVITRSNPSAGDYSADNAVNYTIQYQPVLAPVSLDIKCNGGEVPSTLIIQKNNTITTSWGYQKDSGAAGVVDGYYLEIFTNEKCTGDPYKIITVYDNKGTGTYNINTATELKRGVMNYMKITPFYKCPDTSVTADYIDNNHNIRGTKYVTKKLCKPIAKLNTPVIAYPVNNSTWHNKYFRVLFELPEDIDLQALIDDRTIGSVNNYRYQNIQIQITYPDKSTKVYNTTTSNIWSTETLSYKRRIAVCPALSVLNDVSSYKIKIRVQKNYYITSGDDSWSAWSNEITINKKAVARQTYNKGDKISYSHYMNPRTASVNCQKAYPIHKLPSDNIEKKTSDLIQYKNFKAIYDTILQVKNDVNSYCKYDRESVSFTRDISDFTSNPPKQEYITANDKDTIVTESDGRNYMNLLVDDLNKLY